MPRTPKAEAGRRFIVWPISDPHGGYRFGLMRPGVRLPPMDEDEDYHQPVPTAFQRTIWRHFESDVEYVRRLAGDDEVVVLIMGDVEQGSILRDQMLVTPRASDQAHIIEDALAPVFSMPNVRSVWLVKGTAPHTGRHGSAELRLAKHVRDVYGKAARCHYHFKLNVAGVLFDVAHHGASTGIYPWVGGDQIRRYSRAIAFREMMAGHPERVPRVILRGHYHDRTWETITMPVAEAGLVRVESIVCPGYSLFTDDYTLKATASKDYMTVGTMPIELTPTEGGYAVHVHDRAHSIHVAKRARVDR
jgi:hypothetical protein